MTRKKKVLLIIVMAVVPGALVIVPLVLLALYKFRQAGDGNASEASV